MAQGRQFPIEDCGDTRLCGTGDCVPRPVIAVDEGDRCIADCRRETYVRLWQRTVTRWCIVNYWIKRTGESQGGANAPIGARASAEFESDAGLTDVLAVA